MTSTKNILGAPGSLHIGDSNPYRGILRNEEFNTVLDEGLVRAFTAMQAQNPDPIGTDRQRVELVAVRLRVTSQHITRSLECFATTRSSGKVFVHFVRNSEMVVFDDEEGMFPSDDLITRLRLCL